MSLVTLPITFKALAAPALGAPFELIDRTVSTLAPNEVLVKVNYASINQMDVKIHQYNFLNLPLPLVLGFDFSGVIVAQGEEGVFTGCGEAVTLGSAVTGLTFGFGSGGGCFAEYVVADRERLVLRGDVPDRDACAFPVGYASAWDPLCITTDIRTRSGQTIYIAGGSGGVGHLAVQLAKVYGLRVITSASKPAGLELLRKLGADVIIDYSKQDVVAEVLAATGGRGADVVYDSTYAESSMKQSAAAVAEGGEWIRLGPWWRQPELQQVIEAIVAGRKAKSLVGDLGQYSTDPEARKRKTPLLQEGLRLARQLYAEGLVRPHISAEIPLQPDALDRALQTFLSGTVGKVVVKCSNEQQ